MFTEQLTQALSIPVASKPPANYAANNTTAYTVGPVSMAESRRLLAIINMGVIGANTNVQCYLQASNASGGTYANISSTNQAVTLDTSNTMATIEVRADEIGTNNQYVQLAMLITGSGTGAFLSATLIGGECAYKPGSQYNFDTANTNLKQLVLGVG